MKVLKKILKGLLILFTLILLILFITPLVFKSKLVELAKQEINKNVNAKVEFGNFSLNFFSAFPNLSFVMHDLSIKGTDRFESYSLAEIDKIKLKISPLSIGSSQIGIKSVSINQPEVYAKVLENGMANWDITKESSESSNTQTLDESSSFVINIEQIVLRNGLVIYDDESQKVITKLEELNATLSGDFSADVTDLIAKLESEKFSFSYGGIQYINKSSLTFNGGITANLKNSAYSLNDNKIQLNRLSLNTNGKLQLSDEKIHMQFTIDAVGNTFKDFLSALPAMYNEHFEDLQANGNIDLKAKIIGHYSEEKLPAFELDLDVIDGGFQYAGKSESIDNIQLDLNIQNESGNTDDTKIYLKDLRLKFMGEPLQMSLDLFNPVSNPTVDGEMTGSIDLKRLSNMLPLENIELKGIIDSDFKIKGQLSAIEEKRYSDFMASGNINIDGLKYTDQGTNMSFGVSVAELLLNPEFLEVKNFNSNYGKSDFQLKGKLSNYLSYFLKGETLKGSFDFNSNQIDLNELMELSPETEEETVIDTLPTSFEVPKNLHIDLDSKIDKILYKSTSFTDLNGHISIEDGVLEMKGLDMKMFDGDISMQGLYETRDDKRAKVGLDLDINQWEIGKAAKTFNSIKALVPIIEKCKGRFSASLDYYNSTLNSNMRPDLKSISAKGSIRSDNIRIEGSEFLNKIASALNINSLNNLALKDLNIEFNIQNGRIETKPFNIELNGIKTRIQGVQNPDQTIDYDLQFALPYKVLGNAGESLKDIVSKLQASGLNFSDSDELLIKSKVGGTVTDPKLKFNMDVDEMARMFAMQKVGKQVKEISETARKQADKIIALAYESADKVRTESNNEADALIKKNENKSMLQKIAAKEAAKKIRKLGIQKASKIENEGHKKANAIMAEAQKKIDKLLAGSAKKK